MNSFFRIRCRGYGFEKTSGKETVEYCRRAKAGTLFFGLFGAWRLSSFSFILVGSGVVSATIGFLGGDCLCHCPLWRLVLVALSLHGNVLWYLSLSLIA